MKKFVKHALRMRSWMNKPVEFQLLKDKNFSHNIVLCEIPEKEFIEILHEKFIEGSIGKSEHVKTDPNDPDPDTVIFRYIFYMIVLCITGYVAWKKKLFKLGKGEKGDEEDMEKVNEREIPFSGSSDEVENVEETDEKYIDIKEINVETTEEEEEEEVIEEDISSAEIDGENNEVFKQGYSEDGAKEKEDGEDAVEELLPKEMTEEERFEEILEEKELEHVEECENLLNDQKSELEMDYYKKNQERIDEYKNLCLKVSAVENLYASKARYLRNSKKYMDIALAVFYIQDLIERDGTPLVKGINILKQSSEGDEILDMIVSTIPEEVVNSGIQSSSTLLEDLSKLKKLVIKRSFVEKEQTWMKKNFSRFFAWFMFTDKSELNSVFDNALNNLQAGKLEVAIKVLESGVKRGEGPLALEPWLKMAKNRLRILECLRIMKCHLMNLSHSVN